MNKLPLTEDVLNRLGFSEYWDENCTWGGRTIKFSNGDTLRIIQYLVDEDDNYGYGGGKYQGEYYSYAGWFDIPKREHKYHGELFFLHELYDLILTVIPNSIDEFINRCKEHKMNYYLNLK